MNRLRCSQAWTGEAVSKAEAERVARLDLGHAVRADELVIRPARQDLARQPWPRDRTAQDRHDAALAARTGADDQRCPDLGADLAQVVERGDWQRGSRRLDAPGGAG